MGSAEQLRAEWSDLPRSPEQFFACSPIGPSRYRRVADVDDAVVGSLREACENASSAVRRGESGDADA